MSDEGGRARRARRWSDKGGEERISP